MKLKLTYKTAFNPGNSGDTNGLRALFLVDYCHWGIFGIGLLPQRKNNPEDLTNCWKDEMNNEDP